MNIVYIYADTRDEWNCAEWRCAIPMRAIQRTQEHNAQMLYIREFMQNTDKCQNACSMADIIVVQRNLFGRALTMMQHWQAQGKTVIADFDDAYNLMHPSVKNADFWKDGTMEIKDSSGNVSTQKLQPPPLTQFKWGLRLVDGATVPCRQLAEDWQSYTDIHIVPNYLELPKYTNAQQLPKHEGIIIGWGGSLSHLQSFMDSGVLTALQKVCRRSPNVKVMICGDRRVFTKIELPENQKIYQPFVPANLWPQQLTLFDIGIAPLEGEYDKRRSWIKVLEYMIMKVPWVATNYPPYEDLHEYGILVKNTPSRWEKAIQDMVDNLEDFQETYVQDGYQFALQQSVDENIHQIITTYAKIHQQNNC